ncbi:hypothetical protein EDC56_2195 [Sinobacterium caligoides]|uniref:DUF1415 domain-containing protein n=1 Tax=Sinobacterium caligoides TaxID=933926 RepID=A0A3N2DPP0_9GAMM|nr:DUF1415 domain-containing protein [Sinobacterium caligoides]ROS01750.1 hypothetical protein EDC56_2195 [Sinobacterium caligoides]
MREQAEHHSKIIEQTQRWVEALIVGHNVCPFARREMQNNTIHYTIVEQRQLSVVLEAVIDECRRLDEHNEIETTLIILPSGFEGFYDYLHLVDLANQLLLEQDYESVYQLASMHPDYCFEGEAQDDAANYTNRSPYPMIHIIRESSMERALRNYKEPEGIPERNIDFARAKGQNFFVELLAECMNKHQ